MTTSNKIITSLKDNAVYIPLECLQSEYDSITFVYKKEGASIEKQEVRLGETNSNDAMIIEGVTDGDILYLSTPAGFENRTTKLLPQMNGKRKKKDLEEDQSNKTTAKSDEEGMSKSIANSTKDKSRK
jgi:hypothetical protein